MYSSSYHNILFQYCNWPVWPKCPIQYCYRYCIESGWDSILLQWQYCTNPDILAFGLKEVIHDWYNTATVPALNSIHSWYNYMYCYNIVSGISVNNITLTGNDVMQMSITEGAHFLSNSHCSNARKYIYGVLPRHTGVLCTPHFLQCRQEIKKEWQTHSNPYISSCFSILMFVCPSMGGADCAWLQVFPYLKLPLVLVATDVGIAVCLLFLFDFLSKSFLHPTSYFFLHMIS